MDHRGLTRAARLFMALGSAAAGIYLAALTLAPPLHAQAYPQRPVRIILPYTAGGTTDFLARLLANGLTERLGKPVVVENRPGAGGNVGVDLVAKAAPDGYTLCFIAAGNLVINPFIFPSLPFDALNDLTPVFNVGHAPQLLIIPTSLPATTLREFVALAKANPGAFNYGSAGIGSTPHLAADHFARLAGVDMVHVPYGGMGAITADLVAGRIQMLSVSLPPVRAQIDAGKLRALAAANPTRVAALPDVPTAAEAGLPGYEMTTWFGLIAPRHTSPQIIKILNDAAQNLLDDPQTLAKLAESGTEPIGGSPASFEALIRSDYAKWGPIVKASGVRLE
jgi:tripartite-type tricarboxylate transporter receptor subunit TctC